MQRKEVRHREAYVGAVIASLKALLVERQTQIQADFRVRSVGGTQSDGLLTIDLEPVSSIEDWRDNEQVFRAIADELNERFRSDKWYYGIQVFVPHEFLGKLGAEARIDSIQRERDAAEFRSVRLEKDGKDG